MRAHTSAIRDSVLTAETVKWCGNAALTAFVMLKKAKQRLTARIVTQRTDPTTEETTAALDMLRVEGAVEETKRRNRSPRTAKLCQPSTLVSRTPRPWTLRSANYRK